MFISFKLNRTVVILCTVFILLSFYIVGFVHNTSVKTAGTSKQSDTSTTQPNAKKDYIKWVDFKITDTAMRKAMKADIESKDSNIHINWIDLLSILAVKYGGDFSRFKEADLTALVKRITDGEKIEDITRDMKYYSYYREAYGAVLGEYIGEYEIQEPSEGSENLATVKKYGLKAFSPIARGYGYSHSDDFGNSRSYGFKRKHLGHDMMGNVGTPVIAIESGTVEALGWNQYGGWRIGIRSFDRKRYYYYAHLRKGHPYSDDLSIGHTVKAGDVIGYLGMTGYSSKEDTNNIEIPHLHMGIQLIFDESQKEGNNEIWIDCYEIAKFLRQNTSAVVKDELTGEFRRKYEFMEASTENME